MFGSTIQRHQEVRWDTDGHFLAGTVILGFLSIFKITQVSSHFEAVNSEWLSSCQRDVRPPLIMRQGPRAFSMVSTGDSDIPISFEIKEEPAFKSLQGIPAFFWVRASRCMLHLRPQHQGITHIIIAERSLLLRCLWKVDIPLVSKPDNQLSFWEVLGYTKLSSSCCAEFVVPLDRRRCAWGISGVA